MNGRLVGILLMAAGLIAGAAMYYLQVYGFYEQVADREDGTSVQMVGLVTGEAEPIAYDGFQAINADSSPIRFRACFTTPHSLAMLTETYELLEDATPRNAPGWFDCFDAAEIGAGLQDGSILAFQGLKNVDYGVDQIVAIHQDGRGWIWHDLNDCGEKAYDGTVVGEECPARPGSE